MLKPEIPRPAFVDFKIALCATVKTNNGAPMKIVIRPFVKRPSNRDQGLSRPLNEARKRRAGDEAGADGWRDPL